MMELFTSKQQPCLASGWPWNRSQLSLFIIACLLAVISADEDYFKLLGLSREASTREIRQAFKTLALTMHPDNNVNAQDAHDKFLKIYRAYEVLKDQDLRQKYEKHGEKVLQESVESGGYNTYDFYRDDFGIYDDDFEIVTLDGGDLDAVVNSGELWFVNFYTPQCPQCHQLAPTWREFAKEMDGVVRVGALNCGDYGGLCHRQGVSRHHSLYVFKSGTNTKYFGDGSKESLVEFAMQFVSSKVTELRPGNIFTEIQSAFSSGVGWLITFCADLGDCLESETRQKLAGMLDGLVYVGWIACPTHTSLCSSFEVTSSTTAYFSPGSTLTERESVLFLQSLDAKEIYAEVMQRLPELEVLTKETFKEKLAHHRWLVSFSFGQKDLPSQEHKKLKGLLKESHIQVGKVDCVAERELCASFYIQKPCLVIFKGLGISDFEIHYEGDTLYRIASFAKDSVRAHVSTLKPENFPSGGKEAWLVNFFTPRCPPCCAVLPRLRKASTLLSGLMRFGTLDCTVHVRLCRTYNIHTYPTMLIFNQSTINEYEGPPSAEGILEFIEHLVNPVAVPLTPGSYQELVRRRKPNQVWVVDFYTPWCGPCQALLPEWREMARMVNRIVNVGTVDCQKYHSFCQGENVQSYPEIRLFPQNSSKPDQYQSYKGRHRDALSLRVWALGFLPRASVDLTPEDFRKKVLDGGENWVLEFSAPWCEPCHQFAPEFEMLAAIMKGSVRAGKLDCQAYAHTCAKAGVTAYPTVRFYPYLRSEALEGEDISDRDANAIAHALKQRLRHLSLQEKASKLKDEL